MLIDLCGQNGAIKLTDKVIGFEQRSHIVFTRDVNTAKTDFFPPLSTTATTEGSLRTTPCPFNTTRVLAVPRSIAMSWLQIFVKFLKNFIYIPFTFCVSCSIGAVFFLLIIILFNALKYALADATNVSVSAACPTVVLPSSSIRTLTVA